MKIGEVALHADVGIDTVRSCDRDCGTRGRKAVPREKLAVVGAELPELDRVRDGLRSLLASCLGQGGLVDCPILDARARDAA